MALYAINHREETVWWPTFQQASCPSLVKGLYSRLLKRPFQQAPKDTADITVVCGPDTHNRQPKIHARRSPQAGTATELQIQLDWLDAQHTLTKSLIAGNHDMILGPLNFSSLNFHLMVGIRFAGARSPTSRSHLGK
ncbi:hypothetical protein DOTSEDRAFT_36647 [Dothistroma septosporum NZE10]|uniref:Calcineurin-like phosphoesterase domain-containing protein n=1 Tax=Dothistroma septosporum (strain NZE10 / CBS 128990) TaxID=675120 RepID=N1PIT2_DOTSN|nr:hypothetical protein DOTSEDRAFT_36647 [Dothistroma septosporum NZE10]